MRELKFRGKRIDNGEWVYGFVIQIKYEDIIAAAILVIEHNPTTGFSVNKCYNVIPESVGQLQYQSENEKYFDGDIYYHAGYGITTCEPLCQLQYALIVGNGDDIGSIKGNAFDNPELLKE